MNIIEVLWIILFVGWLYFGIRAVKNMRGKPSDKWAWIILILSALLQAVSMFMMLKIHLL